MKILVIVGTAREGRKSIFAAKLLKEKLLESSAEVEMFDIKEKDIPYLGNRTYIDGEQPTPDDIKELSEKVEDCDSICIVSPEYNHSVPGALKNALDYLYPEYSDKPFTYVTVSAGGFGGVRALDHLQDITLGLGGIPGPNIQVSNVSDVFNSEGELMDAEYEERFEKFVQDSIDFVNKME